jgi:hypothetical protein
LVTDNLKQTSTTYNVFSILQLPIPHARSGKVPIQRCLDAFFNEEILEKDDAWCVALFHACSLTTSHNLNQGLPTMQSQTTRNEETFSRAIATRTHDPPEAIRG